MRALALLAAAAMAVSLFLPWLQAGGAGFVPWDLVKGLEPDLDTARRFVSLAPVPLLVFLATFPLAALFVLLSVLGLPSRLLALVTGGGALGLAGWLVWRTQQGLAEALPLPRGSLQEMAQGALDIAGLGAFAWAGGAVLLLLAGLTGFVRR